MKSGALWKCLIAALATLAAGRTEVHDAAAAAAVPAVARGPKSQGSWNGKLPMAFVENEGQWHPSIKFMSQNGRGRSWLTDTGFVLQLVRHCSTYHTEHGESSADSGGGYEGVNIAFTFEGANPSPAIETQGELPGRYNFFIDNDPAGWHTDARSFKRVIYREMYPNIDLEFYENDAYLEYDFVLRPGANPRDVVVHCSGAADVALDDDGSLILTTSVGSVLHTAPRTSGPGGVTGGSVIQSSLIALGKDRFSLFVNGWSGHSELRIDPVLVFGSYLGGLGTGDIPLNIAVDSLLRPVVVGKTEAGFPTTPGAFQEAYAGGIGDAFITKLSADGTSLVYSTYIGTSNASEGAFGLALIPSGDLVVSGNTSSALFPVTPGAYDQTVNGLNDTWVIRLRADGAALQFSTVLGGSQSETSAAVAVNGTGDIFLAGRTASSNFPVTAGALSTTLHANEDAYIAHLSADGSDLVFATYTGATGGSNQSVAPAGIELGTDGAVYVAGRVSGTGLPVTPGANGLLHHGEVDAFVLKLDGSGSFLHYCTYFGGSQWEDARDIQVNASGSAYIMGMTDSPDLPVNDGAYSSTLCGSDSAYIAKFSPDGSALDFCTYAGGDCFNDPKAFAVDAAGYAYVGGLTCQDFPTTPDALKQGTPGSATDGFLLKLDPAGSFLAYATLIGGDIGTFTPSDTVRAIALDGSGGVYLTGETFASDFPATEGAFDTTMAGSGDGFVAKIDLGAWTTVGHSLAGTGGVEPFLAGTGSLKGGSPGSVTLYNGKPLSSATLIVGLATLNAPFKAGTMVPNPLLMLPLATNASGGLGLSWTVWPAGQPAGIQLLMQYWIVDPGGPVGFSASNGLLGVTAGP